MFGEMFDIVVPVDTDCDGSVDYTGLISAFDSDGDGVADQFAIDYNGDGYFDNYVEGHMDDLNLDHFVDSIGLDTDNDSYDDMRMYIDSYGDVYKIDFSNSFLSQFANSDTDICPGDGHGVFEDFIVPVVDANSTEHDITMHGIDLNGDGVADYFGFDADGDGVFELLNHTGTFDRDDDGIIDGYVMDTNGDLSPDTFVYTDSYGNIEHAYSNGELLDNYDYFLFGN